MIAYGNILISEKAQELTKFSILSAIHDMYDYVYELNNRIPACELCGDNYFVGFYMYLAEAVEDIQVFIDDIGLFVFSDDTIKEVCIHKDKGSMTYTLRNMFVISLCQKHATQHIRKRYLKLPFCAEDVSEELLRKLSDYICNMDKEDKNPQAARETLIKQSRRLT